MDAPLGRIGELREDVVWMRKVAGRENCSGELLLVIAETLLLIASLIEERVPRPEEG